MLTRCIKSLTFTNHHFVLLVKLCPAVTGIPTIATRCDRLDSTHRHASWGISHSLMAWNDTGLVTAVAFKTRILLLNHPATVEPHSLPGILPQSGLELVVVTSSRASHSYLTSQAGVFQYGKLLYI